MSCCKDKSIEKQRGCAIKELIIEKRSVAQVARRYGRNRSRGTTKTPEVNLGWNKN